MSFNDTDKLKALAIVAVFETGKPFGDFALVAVLNDGAGISYGFDQFTHRSGALAAVMEAYLSNGGQVARTAVENALATAKSISPKAITALASDAKFKNALQAAGLTNEMKRAQIEVAMARYMQPAINECFRLGFSHPLSLAVVYDSLTHGSWERFRDAVAKRHVSDEVEWITEYIKLRDRWLASVPRLTSTRYRTRFFLNQIKTANWQLRLPFTVHGVRITNKTISDIQFYLRGHQPGVDGPAAEPNLTNDTSTPETPSADASSDPHEPLLEAQPPDLQPHTREAASVPNSLDRCVDEMESRVNAAAAKYDQIERIATTVTSRNDAAKSLWTTVIGSLTQTFWALFGLVVGVPREVWLVVAIIAAALMLLYLYRQIALGKIRERKQVST